MELKHVIPDVEKTFGNLEFAGEGKIIQERVNGRPIPVSRVYSLYSDVQRADDIEVIIPIIAGEKHFTYGQKVKLVNPRIEVEGYKIGVRGHTRYILKADNLVEG